MGKTKKSALFTSGIAVLGLLFFSIMTGAAEAALWQKLVDYGYPGYSETSNNWTTYNSPQSVNGSYRYLSREVGDGSRTGTATWKITAPYTGIYQVSVSFRKTENRTSDADYYVTNSDGGFDHFSLNQSSHSTYLAWVTLGKYYYVKGQEVLVRLDGTDDSASDCADATSWELLKKLPDPIDTPSLTGARSLLLNKPFRRPR